MASTGSILLSRPKPRATIREASGKTIRIIIIPEISSEISSEIGSPSSISLGSRILAITTTPFPL